MADARIKGEWLNTMRIDNLTDTTWRVFTSALMWSAENGTDGKIPKRYLRMLHPDGEQPAAFTQMEAAGLWAKADDGFQLDDWDGALGQSTALQVETYKANARVRNRQYRERERQKLAKAVGFTDSSGVPVTGDVTHNVTRNVRAHVGIGKGIGKGTGIEASSVDETESVDQQTGEVIPADLHAVSWPTVEIPKSDPGYCVACGSALPCSKKHSRTELARLAS